MRILVTGGAGFIGSSLVDVLLNYGHEVVVIDNFNDFYSEDIKNRNIASHLENKKYKLFRGDIENISDLEKVFEDGRIDVVYHLAARAGIRPSLINPLEYAKTNYIGTLNVLDTMRFHGVKRIFFASSSSVYGNCTDAAFSEDTKVSQPISPYAATKAACESLIYTYTHLYDISAMCFRFFTVYGPRQRPDLAIHKFARKIVNGEYIQMYGDGSSKRDYTYIADVVSALAAALKVSDFSYEIVNLGGGEPIVLSRMISELESALGMKAFVKRFPMQPGDVNRTVCDWSKARALLGYMPHTSFSVGIHNFVNWFRLQMEASI